jgi:carboxyl-terminal processing protease
VRRRPRPSLAASLRVVLAVVATLLVFGAGVFVGGHPVDTGLTRLPDAARDVVLGDSGEDLPGQVLAVLEDRYYREIDAERLERDSVQAIIAALGDRFTTYLTEEELRALRAHVEGAFFGIGVGVAERGGAVVVTRVYPDSPAARAGVAPGARIVSVDGVAVAGRGLRDVARRIRGPEGTTVTIGLAPPGGGDGAVREIALERARIAVSAVVRRVARSGGTPVGVVRLLRFTRGAGDDVRRAVSDLAEQDVRALVLDLRGDPGGLVREAVRVSGAFLADGSPVVTTEGRHSPRRTLRTDGTPAAPDLPLVVLVDRASASASEIVAGALRDADRATLVGTRTYGKALVQTTEPLRDGGALTLTTARYLTPDGEDVSTDGLAPQVRASDDPRTPADEALRRALAVAARG